jgi:hypothetical protein
MKIRILYLALLCALPAQGAVEVDIDAFGKSLGGWMARKGKAAEYEVSEAGYRTYIPEISPSPDGGIFVSVRIDHRRGFMASDDHASLELSFAPDGSLVSAQSSLALQGRTISSDLIKGGASASTSVAAPGIDRAVKVGTDLVADLSSKLLREKIVEPGRVSFPAAIRHNYNLLYLAVRHKTAEPAAPDANAIPGASTPLKPEGSASPLVPSSTMKVPATPPSAPPPAPGAAGTAPATAPVAPAPTATGAAPGGAVAAPPAPVSTSAAGKPPQASTSEASKKKEPSLEIKPYNPGGVTTPIPPKKDQSLIRAYGGDVLKIARDVVKAEVK